MLMLKHFTNLLFALFGDKPLLQETKINRGCLPIVLSKYTDKSNHLIQVLNHVGHITVGKKFCAGKDDRQNTVSWQVFPHGQPRQGEKYKTISHMEVCIEPLHPSRKRQSVKEQNERQKRENREDPPQKKGKSMRLLQPYSAELKNIFDIPIKEANNPGINFSCKFCAVSKEDFLPNIGPPDCIQFFRFRNHKYGKTCKFHHQTATRVQVARITDKSGHLLKNPSSIKCEKPHPNTPKISLL